MRDAFNRFSPRASSVVGTSWVFIFVVVTVCVWALTGPMFHFSNTWQLVINTGKTIIAFLMVLLIQNTQNRDARAIHLKLDEVISSTKNARDRLIDLENCTDDEITELREEFAKIREKPSGARSAKPGQAKKSA